ncbi:MAG: ABC transporter ATP-binding protein [Acidobacteria bacterium]|nr:ABC transporter ATP-binding protein [Acidobacteriota bacterium]
MTSGPSETALEARHLYFSYRRPVVIDFSLGLSRDEVVGIIGPNGCGKTTVLRLLDGILTPQSGEVLLAGSRPLLQLTRKEIAQRMALVPQNGAVLGYQTVFQFVLQGRSPHLSLMGFESAADEEIAREALELTRLGPYAGERVSQISGGEKQRLRLARALAQRPEILLLDEFTANLDVNFQVELMRLVVRITRERHLATLVVSHEINMLAAFCDRMVLMADGAIRSAGAPSDVITGESLRDLFGIDFTIRFDITTGPEVLPVIKGAQNHGLDSSTRRRSSPFGPVGPPMESAASPAVPQREGPPVRTGVFPPGGVG